VPIDPIIKSRTHYYSSRKPFISDKTKFTYNFVYNIVSSLRSLCLADVGSVAEDFEVQAASIFMVDVYGVNECFVRSCVKLTEKVVAEIRQVVELQLGS
jgi:hypothetical protein